MRLFHRATPIVLAVSSFAVAAPALAQQEPPPPPPAGVTLAPPPPPPAPPPPPPTPAPAPPPVYPAPPLVVAPVAVSLPPAPPPRPADNSPAVQLTSLRVMREKGILTQAEYDSAVAELTETSGKRAGDATSFVVGKWSTTFYGFAEADYIYDSTESYNDLAGNGQVAHPTSYAANNPRSQFSIRNSRLGFRFRAPEFHAIRASATIETDFLGSWANPTYTAATGQPSENQFFTSPVLRVRHAYLKVETPIVDALFGQYWHLFGWQTAYHPNTVQIQGVPGELYSRTPQLRLSKTIESSAVTFDIALAAMRPPQRDSAIPEGEAGVHLALNKWTGTQTMGATGTTVSPASIAVTGDLRGFGVANLPNGGTVAMPAVKSTFDVAKVGGAIAVDAFIPVVPSTKAHMGNSLSILGEFVRGSGIGDLYTGLSGGLGVPATVALPVGSPAGTAATPYNPQVDPGIVTISSTGVVTLIQWQTVRAGLQYYLPGLDGKMWISANYANVFSPNEPTLVSTITPATMTTKAVTNASTLRNALNWFDVNVMGDLTPAVRLGLEYAYSADKYLDGLTGTNHRVQGSAFFIF
jgi:hypothetical protein